MGLCKDVSLQLDVQGSDLMLPSTSRQPVDQRPDLSALAKAREIGGTAVNTQMYVIVTMRKHTVKMVGGEPLIGTYARCARYLVAMADLGNEQWTFIPYNGKKQPTPPQGSKLYEKKEDMANAEFANKLVG